MKISYKEISKFPAVKRDLALLLDKNVQFAEIEKIAYDTEKKLLREVELFDVYEGKNLEPGKKSYAVSFLLQDESQTLNDKMIDKIMSKLVKNLEDKLGAIKNALGKDQSDYKSMTYEGYGPHGIAVFVDTLTDNTTRTVADVRSVFNKFGGNLGTMGSLAFLFDHKCMFTFKIKEGMDMEELILDLIDYDVEDEYEQDDEEGTITIYGDPKSYAAIQKHLEECGFEDVGGDFTYIPNDLKDVTPEQRETLDKMIERLEEFDDVQTVYTNMKPEGGEEE